jgi:nuclear protein localization family protein 4
MTGVAAAVEKERQHEEALKRLEEVKNAPPKQEEKKEPVVDATPSGKPEAKHKQFDQIIIDEKKKCQHQASAKCQHCTFDPPAASYRQNKECTNGGKHRPYPEGQCAKCKPPAVNLGIQKYRHVDNVVFMHDQQVRKFIGFWTQGGCKVNRMAHLYGYYCEDPTYESGIRCVVEYIYDPPQIGDRTGTQELDDNRRRDVEKIAAALGLEHVGLIFTKIGGDTVLSDKEVRRAARMQEDYMFMHPVGYKVSKQVTVVVKAELDERKNIIMIGGQPAIETRAFMVSDMCQALERDNVFGESKDGNKMRLRDSSRADPVPEVLE